jgi:hypothetical protein
MPRPATGAGASAPTKRAPLLTSLPDQEVGGESEPAGAFQGGHDLSKIGMGAGGNVTVTNKPKTVTKTTTTTINVNASDSGNVLKGMNSLLIWTFALVVLTIGVIMVFAFVMINRPNPKEGGVPPVPPPGGHPPREPPHMAVPRPTREKLLNANQLKPYINRLGMSFVYVSKADVCFSVYETRKSDFRKAAEVPAADVDSTDDEHHPVVSVTLKEIEGFLSWLSDKDGVTYRLPTDREWSLAAGLFQEPGVHAKEHEKKGLNKAIMGERAPKVGNFADRNYVMEFGTPKAPSIRSVTLSGDDRFAMTAPVGTYDADSTGLFDLGGNVWEWCFDDNKRTHYLRGGSWQEWDDERTNLHYRREVPKQEKAEDIGFRCVIELP